MTEIFAGTIPALMTPCNDRRAPDFAALARKGKQLVEAGMSAVVYCGSMGDWPLLDDEQRMEGVERLVKAGVAVVVGTGAQNPNRAAALAAHSINGNLCSFLDDFLGHLGNPGSQQFSRPRRSPCPRMNCVVKTLQRV